MHPLPTNSSDSEPIALVDRWATLLEREDYERALELVGDRPGDAWTAEVIRDAIKRHGDHVTLEGVQTGVRPHEKEVTRWPTQADGSCGDIWYDLYVDGRDSDLTATFDLRLTDEGIMLYLIDIRVM